MSKENYDRLSLLDPQILSEEEKKEMNEYIVFNRIVNIALAKQRGVDIEKNGMAKELLTLPNEIFSLIADSISMIKRMKTEPRINVSVPVDETFRDAFTENSKKLC